MATLLTSKQHLPWAPIGMADGLEDDGEYDEDGEGEVVHPMVAGVGKSKWSSSDITGKMDILALKESTRLPTLVVDDEDTFESESASDQGNDDVDCSVNDEERAKSAEWTKHTRRAQSTMPMPPPPPVDTSLASPSIASNRAAQYATVSARRVTEYRIIQSSKEEEVRRQEAGHLQRVKAIRRSNKPTYESYGVANLTPQERLARTLKAVRQRERAKELSADLERKNRWYNQQSTRRNAAAAHARTLASKEHCQRKQQERHRQEMTARIRTSLDQLKVEAKEIAAQSTSAYVKGSYLLKARPKQPKASKPAIATANPDTT